MLMLSLWNVLLASSVGEVSTVKLTECVLWTLLARADDDDDCHMMMMMMMMLLLQFSSLSMIDSRIYDSVVV